MNRAYLLPGLVASLLLLPGPCRGQEAGGTVLNVSYRPFSDADIARLPAPEKLEVLVLRGRLGYGSNTVTDAGIALLTRCKNLRVLGAGGLELSDRALEAIGKLTNLEELSLDSNRITGEGLRHLAGLKKLRRLDLNFNPLRPDTLAALAALPALTQLLAQGSFAVDDRVLETCSRLTHLEELRLPERAADVTDRGLEHLARLKRLKNLTLYESRGVTDAGLARLAGLTRLEEVFLRDLRSVSPRGVAVVGKLAELRRLDLDRVPMDDDSVRALGGLKKLEHLLLWSVANRPLKLDPLGGLSSLREFRTNQVVSSSMIRILAKLDHLESIPELLTEVTDEDLKYLARLPRLRLLALGSEHVTAASLPTLARMKSLRYLYVTENVRISPEQLAELGRSSLRQCQIGSYRAPYPVYHRPENPDPSSP